LAPLRQPRTHHPCPDRRYPILLALLLWLSGGAAGPSAALDYEDIIYDSSRFGPEKPLSAVLQEAGMLPPGTDSIPNPRLEIEKAAHQLRLYSGDRLLKTYRVQLGKRPRGSKTRKYDSRTPVGSYRVCGRNRGSRYYLSLQINYPNEEDIGRALTEKRISLAVAGSLRNELASGDCPNGRTRLGGEIFIHGQFPKVTRQLRREKRKPSSRTDLQPGDLDPGAMKEWYNWTSGCIGMANPDIRELYKYVPDGTPVKITE
jgi:murein L,D-transpeptidase YafK